MKRLLSLLLSLCLFCTLPLPALAEERDTEEALRNAEAFLISRVSAPEVGSVGGEWAVLALARSGAAVPEGYFAGYLERAERYVNERAGILHRQKYTEYSRVALALTAVGQDPSRAFGYDLLAPLTDVEQTVAQGVNGAIFALLALNAHSAEKDGESVREAYLSYLLNARLPDGGWAFSGTLSEPDMTAMALTALAPYQSRAEVSAALNGALEALSGMQSMTGGFPSYGAESAESTAQVLVALSTLRIPVTDPRFVKNGISLLQNLLTYQTPEGGFCHLSGDEAPDLMATEQASYALAALLREEWGQTALYDMTDVPFADPPSEEGLSRKHPDVVKMPVTQPGKTFPDIAGHPARTAILALAARGIINGKSDLVFDPDSTMTRAEFAAIVTRALGLPQTGIAVFGDVTESDWFFTYIGTAYTFGIVKGVSETAFLPGGTMTREEAAVMVARAARLAGMDTSIGNPVDILCLFTDYPGVSDWATDSVAFCYREGILPDDAMEILPKTPIRRAEIAQMLYETLKRSQLL